jgi:predicted transcriptional regulator
MNEDKEIKEILKELLRWTKFEGMQKVKQVLEVTLDSDVKKLIYEMSNGLSSPEIAQAVGVAEHTVRNYWKDWSIIGIVEIHPEFKKRFCRVFSLREIGIESPKSKTLTAIISKDQETDEGVNSEQ